MSAPTLEQAYTQEVAGLMRGGFRFKQDFDAAEAAMLIGELQLALRHKGNTAAPATFARQLVFALTKQFPKSYTAIHEVIKQGWEQTP